jgi:lipoate-protein ligase B
MPEQELITHKFCETCFCGDLGIIDVPVAEAMMSDARALRSQGDAPDLLLFLAHPRTVALGMRDYYADHPKDLLVSPAILEHEGIALTRSVRGGGITYHWPGQVACYPVVKLGTWERDIPRYMNRLEQVAIEALRCFGVTVIRREGRAAYIGLWHNGAKVVSMGVRVSNWVTSFGFAINLDGNHAPSKYVRPCGLEGVELLTVEEILGKAPARAELIEAVKERFASIFGRALCGMSGEFFRSLGMRSQANGVALRS